MGESREKNRSMKKVLSLLLTAALLFADAIPSLAQNGNSSVQEQTETALLSEVNGEDASFEETEGTEAAELLEAKGYSGKIDLANWLALMDDDAVISEINLPGTHDSGWRGVAYVVWVNQILTLKEQMNAGIRYMDLRFQTRYDLQAKRNEYYIAHGIFVNGWSIGKVFKEFSDFVKDHPTEFVIADVTYEKDAEHKEDIRTALRKIMEADPDHFMELKRGGRVPTLGECRGKVLVVDHLNPEVENFINSKLTGSCDTLPHKKVEYVKNYLTAVRDQHLFEPATFSTTYNYDKNADSPVCPAISCYKWYLGFLPERCASLTMPWLIKELKTGKYNYKRIGWFLADFGDAEYAEALIRTNDFTHLDHENYAYWGYSKGKLTFSRYRHDNTSKGFRTDFGYDQNTVPWSKYADSITKVVFSEPINVKNTTSWFEDCTKLESMENLQYLNVDSFPADRMFSGCSLLDLDLKGLSWKLTSMKGMFAGCRSVTGLEQINISAITDLTDVFKGCGKVSGVENWDVSKIRTMKCLFRNCQGVPDLSKWDVKSCTSMREMFEGAVIPSNTCKYFYMWYVANVTDMKGMFHNAVFPESTDLNLQSWEVGKVTTLEDFLSGTNLRSVNLNRWYLTNCRDFTNMFSRCGQLESVSLLDVEFMRAEKDLDFYWMFARCPRLRKIEVSDLFHLVNPLLSKFNTQVFVDCYSIRGGNQTSYDSRNEGFVMFRIDGENGEKGYLTAVHQDIPVEVESVTAVYDGQPHSISVRKWGAASGYTMMYIDKDGNATETVPEYTEAGTYPFQVFAYETDGTGQYYRVRGKWEVKLEIQPFELKEQTFYARLDVTEPAGSLSETGIWVRRSSDPIVLKPYVVAYQEKGAKELVQGTDYTVDGILEMPHQECGIYDVTIKGTGNYSGETKLRWEIISDSEDVYEENVNDYYNGDFRAAEAVPGGIYDNLDTTVEYCQDGVNWVKHRPTMRNTGLQFYAYRIRGYSKLLGAASGKLSPSDAEEKKDSDIPEEEEKDGTGLLSLIGATERKPVRSTEGWLFINVDKAPLTVNFEHAYALPGVPFDTPKFTLSGAGAEAVEADGLQLEPLVNGSASYFFKDPGSYEITVRPKAAKDEKLAENYNISCSGGKLTVLDISRNVSDAYAIEGEDEYFELRVEGTEVSTEHCTFQWEELIGGDWKEVTESTGKSPTLQIKAQRSIDGREYRCKVRIQGKTGSLITESAGVHLVRAIREDEISVTNTTATYNKAGHSITVNLLSSDIKDASVRYKTEDMTEYSAEPVVQKNAGTVVVEYIVEKANYIPLEGKAELTVFPADAKAGEMGVWFSDGRASRETVYDGQEHPVTAGKDSELLIKAPEDAGELKILYGTSRDNISLTEFPTRFSVSYDDGWVTGWKTYYKLSSQNYQSVIGELKYTIKPASIESLNIYLYPANQFSWQSGKEYEVKPYFGSVAIGEIEKGFSFSEASVFTASEKGTYQIEVVGTGDYTGVKLLEWKISDTVPQISVTNVQVPYEEGSGNKYHAEVKVTKPVSYDLTYYRYKENETTGEAELEQSKVPFEYSEPGTYQDFFTVTDKNTSGDRYDDYIGATTVSIFNISAEDQTVEYDGAAHSIYVDVQGLISAADDEDTGSYTVVYSEDGVTYTANNPGYRNAGTYQVYYKAYRNDSTASPVCGSAKLTITPAALSDADLELAPASVFGYDGKEHTVSLLVKGGLLDQESYELDASSDALTQKTVGTYRAAVKGKGNYTGTAAVQWKITAGKLPEITVKDYYGYYDDCEHAASLELPAELDGATVTYYAGKVDLDQRTNGQTEPVRYRNAGTWYSYYLVEKSGYEALSGIMTVSLASYDLISWTGPYDGLDHGVTVNLSKELEENTTVFYATAKDGEYSRKAPAFTDVNEAEGGNTVYVRFRSAVYGELEKEAKITISSVEITEEDIVLSPQSVFAWDGKEKNVTVLYKGHAVKDGMTVSGQTAATGEGSYQVTVTGTGNYTGAVTRTWKITAQPLPGVEVTDYRDFYDGLEHSASVKVAGDQDGVTIRYYHYGIDPYTGAYGLVESDTPFAYSESGQYIDMFEVTKTGCDSFVGIMKVTILETKLTVQVGNDAKLVGQTDPAFTYSILNEHYETKRLRGLVYSREAGETRGSYAVTAQEEVAGINELYALDFKPGTLKILDVSYKTSPASITVRPGGTAVFTVYGNQEDMEQCIFVWERKAVGSGVWEEIQEQDYTHVLRIPNVTKDMSGTRVRCMVLAGSASDTYSKEAVLTVGDSDASEDTSSETGTPGFSQNADGSWSYRKNGVLLKNCWEQISYTYCRNGLQESATDWFRFDKNGKMLSGWYQDEKGDWYYLNEVHDGTFGRMMTGLVQDSTGKSYYLNTVSDGTKGKMLTGWHTIAGKRYYFIEDKTSKLYGSLRSTAR